MKARKKPYTRRGIVRVLCARCGLRASQQWSACAAGRGYFPSCDACDIKLNELILDFFAIPGRGKMMERYRNRSHR